MVRGRPFYFFADALRLLGDSDLEQPRQRHAAAVIWLGIQQMTLHNDSYWHLFGGGA
jgi:hypothetical protein